MTKVEKDLLLTCPLAASMKSCGSTYAEIALALHKLQEQTLQELIRVNSICPKRIKVGDEILVWHCPDELIPLSE